MAQSDLINAKIAELGITMKTVFIPFSQSRNKAEKNPSLNWSITLQRDGKAFLTTYYMAGAGHCPSYDKKAPASWHNVASDYSHYAVAWECEKGKAVKAYTCGAFMGSTPIEPKLIDVLYSIVMDSTVLHYAGFEQWASEFGYEADSRKAEKIFQACLSIAMQTNAAIGPVALEQLAIVYQDY